MEQRRRWQAEQLWVVVWALELELAEKAPMA
jgi:hypothetical protein